MPNRGRRIYVVVFGYGLSVCGVLGASSSKVKASRVADEWTLRVRQKPYPPWIEVVPFVDGAVPAVGVSEPLATLPGR